MRKIHTLPDHIVAKIAAGEVIERPMYAVKELIENSLDAGATSITIQIEEAGLKKIIVSDDGEGMSAEDLAESFKPHTTSKLFDDLIGVQTLGFRGEALSSIAAISTMKIQSRLKNETAGTHVTVKFGKVEHLGPIGMPPGTTVSVNNLFSNIPARKKFLKSERTEFRHIVELITQYALSFPAVRFSLIHNERIIFDLPKQTLTERLEKLLSKSFYNQLLPLTAESSWIKLSGFIARPQISTGSQTKQYLFINNRVVSDRLIMTAIKDAYGNLLEKVRYPVFILFVDLPYEMVDINVHPRKEQIKFLDTTLALDTVKSAVEKTLSENNLTFSNSSFFYSPTAGTTETFAADVLRETIEPWNIKDIAHILKSSDIYQLHNTYLVVQTKNGILLIDQHAAHERILYEQFLKEFEKQKKYSGQYRLKKPVIINLSFSETELILEHLKTFQTMNFEIEEFSENVFRVNAVPQLLKDRNIKNLILELLENVSQEKSSYDVDHASSLMIAFLACRAAIKAGDKLTREEAKRLIEKLEKTPNNATCPHGRPAKLEIPLREFHKMFKRK